jgi:hypothetical protein
MRDYLEEASQRKDTNPDDLPEQYGDYMYGGQYATFPNGNDYQIVERTNKEGVKENVLDISLLTQFKKH